MGKQRWLIFSLFLPLSQPQPALHYKSLLLFFFSCSSSPFSSGAQIFSRTQTLVLYIQSSWYAAHVSRTIIQTLWSVFRRTSSPPSFQIHITLCSLPTTWLDASLFADWFLLISISLCVVSRPDEPLLIVHFTVSCYNWSQKLDRCHGHELNTDCKRRLFISVFVRSHAGNQLNKRER